MKKWIVGIIVILILVWIGVSVSEEDANTAETGPIKIGFSLPLTGDVASFGESAQAGVNLAIDEINQAGGINGREVVAVFEDDQCVARLGATVFNKLTSVDKVDAIIGPLCSPIAGAGLPIAEDSNTPTIFWASAPGLPDQGEHLFRTWPSDTFAGKESAEFIFNELGKRNVAILYVNNDWGVGLRNVFTEVFEDLGGTIVLEEGIPQDATDLKTTAAKTKAANPDAIYMPAFPSNAVIALQEISDLGLDVDVVGAEGFEDPSVISLPEAEGVLYMIASWNNPDEFKARIQGHSGIENNFMAPLGYDAVKLLAEVMQEHGTDSASVMEGLSEVSYTDGVGLSLIEFDENGDLTSARYDVKVIQGGESKVYERE